MRKNIDWNEIQRRRNIGTPVSQLAKELGVSDVTVYTRTASPSSHVKVHANGFHYVDLGEVPMRKRTADGDPFYTGLAAALLGCPAGKAVPFYIPARPAAAKNPQGALRGGIERALRNAGKARTALFRGRGKESRLGVAATGEIKPRWSTIPAARSPLPCGATPASDTRSTAWTTCAPAAAWSTKRPTNRKTRLPRGRNAKRLHRKESEPKLF